MRHGSLFSGIGGFDLASEWMGWENIFHCEWNPFGQKILKYYWPNAKSYEDITKTDFSIHRGKIDILTGGFPCQPYSSAGKRLGKEDNRHLWPEMLRAIQEIKPKYIVGENVLGIVNWNGGLVFDEIQVNLEDEGYETLPIILPACAVNAPHRRERTWFLAYPNNSTEKSSRKSCWFEGKRSKDINESKKRREQTKQHHRCRHVLRNDSDWESWLAEPVIRSDNDGLSKRLDGITVDKWEKESIKAYGNAIVPQVAYQIFKSIDFCEASLSVRNEGNV